MISVSSEWQETYSKYWADPSYLPGFAGTIMGNFYCSESYIKFKYS